jgi:hypothetical protein
MLHGKLSALALTAALGMVTLVELPLPLPGPPATRAPSVWAAHVHRMDEALARRDVAGAARAWEAARDAALRARTWPGLLAVGDAALRWAAVAPEPAEVEGRARETYRAALAVARQGSSLDGVLGVAEALADLDDDQGVDESLRVARHLAAGRPEDLADLRAATMRLGR